MPYLLAAVGLVALLIAGDWLVKGAVNLSLRLGVPALIVSLTIVAFGTSAPELLISIDAVLSGVPGLALGNVVGSNTANVLLVLGLPALLFTLDTRGSQTQGSYAEMAVATVVFIAIAMLLPLTWWTGLILLAALAAILTRQFIKARAQRVRPDDVEGADTSIGWPRILLFLAGGLVGLPIGAHLLISNATIIAENFGLSDAVIGLTLVAIGTSLPELATTVAAARKGQADVALGNAIGSNLFNLLAIIGITALVGEIPVDESFKRLDFWVMLGAAVILAPFVFTDLRMNRVAGAVLCALYGAYMWVIL